MTRISTTSRLVVSNTDKKFWNNIKISIVDYTTSVWTVDGSIDLIGRGIIRWCTGDDTTITGSTGKGAWLWMDGIIVENDKRCGGWNRGGEFDKRNVTRSGETSGNVTLMGDNTTDRNRVGGSSASSSNTKLPVWTDETVCSSENPICGDDGAGASEGVIGMRQGDEEGLDGWGGRGTTDDAKLSGVCIGKNDRAFLSREWDEMREMGREGERESEQVK